MTTYEYNVAGDIEHCLHLARCGIEWKLPLDVAHAQRRLKGAGKKSKPYLLRNIAAGAARLLQHVISLQEKEGS